MKQSGNIKVALVHDFLTQYGGAEKVLESLAGIFPDAPIYTLLYDKEKMRGRFEGREIRTSFLQRFPKFLRKRKRYLLPFLPTAPETFDLRDFDLVISSSGAWTKGIVTRLNTVHISYLHSPARFLWDYREDYFRDIGKKPGFFKRLFLNYLRVWDFQAAQRPDILIANSKYTRERIKKYYRRKSDVVYPPAIIESEIRNPKPEINSKFLRRGGPNSKFFLVVSRLSAYKKADLAVEAFKKMDLPLVIIGEGEQESHLRRTAGKNIKVLGWKSDEEIKKYYQGARALIFPAVDDFGITMVEAMSHGVPVVALRKGGAREVVEEGVTGEFFDAQIPEVLSDGVRRFMENEKNYNPDIIREKAQRFTEERFKEEILRIIGESKQNGKLVRW
ncbi:MAG: glycosyltransferase [Candidatus Moranbacteria bacterium]|jgi:glycosyltransferase involved in cell wall biosynthesis|nr:glycosyltransferase [Candidatus Moranbacteria bacterium]MDD5652408.1 glycosyltransferase [Candidatus Moranbacteria bacterium]MDX9855449.1 glycosyltransferase [Candidatus Moranbacteria bacterium]